MNRGALSLFVRKVHHWTSKNRDFVKIKFPSTEAFAAWSLVLLDEVQQIRCKVSSTLMSSPIFLSYVALMYCVGFLPTDVALLRARGHFEGSAKRRAEKLPLHLLLLDVLSV